MLSYCLLSLALTMSHTVLTANASALPRQGKAAGFQRFKFDAHRQPRQVNAKKANGTFINVTNEEDVIYRSKVNVGGKEFNAVIDTGSTDTWVHAKPSELHITNDTHISLNLAYGIGDVSGDIVYAPLTFGNYQIPEQIILAVNEDKDLETEALVGLGLDSLSKIYTIVNNHTGHPVPSAQSVLSSIFDLEPDRPNFIGLYLERSENHEDTTGGILSISEYYPQYSKIADTPKYPLVPKDSTRWTIGVENMMINNKSLPLNSSVPGAAQNTSVALIDSGTSLAYMPTTLVNLLYSNIEGAVHYVENGDEFWIVPCLQPANVSFTFGQQRIAVNPLELTTLHKISDKGKEYTICTGAFRPPLGPKDQLDFILGDTFMRNVYSVFNFGDTSGKNFTGEPSIQLYPLTDEAKAYADFTARRNATLKDYPPLLDLSKLNQTNLNGTNL